MIPLLGMLTLAALGITALLALIALVPPGRAALGGVLDSSPRSAIVFAWFVALVATLGSLYLSEIRQIEPCMLCWYQRIAMYPLVVIMGIAAWKRDTGIRKYVLPLMVIGGLLALYQYIIGYIPDAEILGCSLDVSCTVRYIWEFGFVDFPFMSFVGFSFMTSLMLWTSPSDRNESDE